MEVGNIFNDNLMKELPYGDDAIVTLRYIARNEINRIEKQGANDTMSNVLLGRASVKGWENIEVDGNKIDFNQKNLDLLMNRSYDFSNFVNINCIIMSNFIEEKQEEIKKK